MQIEEYFVKDDPYRWTFVIKAGIFEVIIYKDRDVPICKFYVLHISELHASVEARKRVLLEDIDQRILLAVEGYGEESVEELSRERLKIEALRISGKKKVEM